MPRIAHPEQLCDAFLVGKQRRAPFPAQAHFRASEPLELVHADLCGPIDPTTPAGKKYFLLCIDDHNRYMSVHLLEKKSDVGAALKRAQAAAELELNKKLRTLRTDRGGEFTSAALAAYFDDTGVQ